MRMENNYGKVIAEAGFVQRREWMLHQVRDDGYPFNVSFFIETAFFDREVFIDILDWVIGRHEVLRTTLSVMDDRLCQVICPIDEFEPDISFFDLRSMSDPDSRAFYDQKVAEYMGQPFDFDEGPLFRILVFEARPDYTVAYFILHHVITDQHSTELLNQEIVDAYKAQFWKNGTQAEVSVQYRDYVEYENGLLLTSTGNEARIYWKKQLSTGIPEITCIDPERRQAYEIYLREKIKAVCGKLNVLPYSDRQQLASVVRRYQVEDAGEIDYVYDHDLVSQLGLFRNAGHTGLLGLLAGSILLAFHNIDGQQRIAMEIPVTRRISPFFYKTMGWMTGSGPCILTVPDPVIIPSFLQYIEQQLYDLSKFCTYPYETLFYEDSDLPGSHMPVFLTLSYFDSRKHDRSPGIAFQRSAGSGTYQDIAFSFAVYEDALTLHITYNNLLFTDKLVLAVLESQVTALKNMLMVMSRQTPEETSAH